MAILAASLMLTACGGDSGSTATTTTDGQATTNPVTTITGTSLATITTDPAGNLAVIGQVNGASSLSDVFVTKIDTAGSALPGWPKSIAASAGTTTAAKVVAANATHVATLHNELPSGDLFINLYTADGIPAMVQTNVGNDVDAGDLALDSAAAYVSRVSKVGSLTENQIFKADLNGNLQAEVLPPMKPTEMDLDAFGLYVAGENMVVKYDKALTAPIWTASWSTGASPRIDDIMARGFIYVAGVSDGNLLISAYREDGTVLFSKLHPTIVITAGQQVSLGMNSALEICLSVGGKFGKFDALNGNQINPMPVDVPLGQFAVVGLDAYFVSLDKVVSLYTWGLF